MNLYKFIVVVAILIAGIFIIEKESIAGKTDKCSPWPACKDGASEPPPPDGCVDSYPGFLHGFLYVTEPKRRESSELRLASYDGCTSELIPIPTDRGSFAFRLTTDGSEGIIVWTEGDTVRRMDLTIDELGKLSMGPPVTILPLTGEEAEEGDQLSYKSLDVWGDATHTSLYMTVLRSRSGPAVVGDTKVAMIYDLNELTDVTASPDVRVIYSEGAGDWQDSIGLDCSVVTYPQFVPTCYSAEEMIFNPSGTRLYFPTRIDDHDDQLWDTVARIHIDMSGGPTLADWTLTGPELVYTGVHYDYWPHGTQLHPESNPLLLPTPELIGMTYWRRRNSYPEFFHVFLNTDQCASQELAPLSGGNLQGAPDIFKKCIDNSILSATTTHGSFQSANAILFGQGNGPDLYRRYVDGGMAGIEEVLIQKSNFADTGL
jgi:hypothetical protein